ncbi:hypothetical protein U879_01855 [Defluviimonas sp. 20V17]|uniref:Uncharacterized protein n=1 Tax=Allgaiera indica TaxID=765699 RepID=A0AAN4UUE4_9RHOB|nr:hypothetical protein [Allgaiera indica]KDB05384.1 hypothetical protein U879_01855 [Defluviimonas sp. 20V17]GHE04184.1 hypothetical protein GCM10008024_30370 [Allgaiera indica]SDX50665.1 hypothetical protein SAMN05444006_11856 [Allgaiera indica]
MEEFNRLTLVAAIEVLEKFHSRDDMKILEVQWDIQRQVGTQTSKSGRVAAWARVAATLNPTVWTEEGQMPLQRAIVKLALTAPDIVKAEAAWRKYLAGLRYDGFEVVYGQIPHPSGRVSMFSDEPVMDSTTDLRRMLPADVPELDFREAESELEELLNKHRLLTALGHLAQARSSYQRGDWAAANSQLRTFFESYLAEIAARLGYASSNVMTDRLKFLGEIDPPFLMASYNEWLPKDKKVRSQFVEGLWSRMHPEGSHPGLSEEEDSTFRLQITLVTARLFLRRFDERLKSL